MEDLILLVQSFNQDILFGCPSEKTLVRDTYSHLSEDSYSRKILKFIFCGSIATAFNAKLSTLGIDAKCLIVSYRNIENAHQVPYDINYFQWLLQKRYKKSRAFEAQYRFSSQDIDTHALLETTYQGKTVTIDPMVGIIYPTSTSQLCNSKALFDNAYGACQLRFLIDSIHTRRQPVASKFPLFSTPAYPCLLYSSECFWSNIIDYRYVEHLDDQLVNWDGGSQYERRTPSLVST